MIETKMTTEEKAIVEKYKDKIYFRQETMLGNECIINKRTVYSIAIRAGLVKPEITHSYDRRDNCININYFQHDFYGGAQNEVLSIYRFCKQMAKDFPDLAK
jgi:hypothetical protein